MKIAIVGVTGLVGSVMLKVLEESSINVSELILVASDKSIGKKIMFGNLEHEIIGIDAAIQKKPHIAIFSAGSSVSREYAQAFAYTGTYVIDNSSCWRMHEHIKLVVPEVNGNLLSYTDKIIANPNCSTIQIVLALAPLHEKYKIKRLVISTYQSVTGTGVKAVAQMENERLRVNGPMAYHYEIDKNCIPHGGDFLDNGYTTEEIKLVNETRKILGDNSIQITATVVRVPVVGGHSESVNIEFKNNFEINDIYSLLNNFPGITVQDDPKKNIYPMPIFAHDKNDVFVGRIRRDESQENSLNMWIVSDNLRKGAATNAIQIAELLIKKGFVVS